MDKEALFAPRLPEEDVEIPGIGTVRVRGLSRIEAVHVQAADAPAVRDRRILALGMVDPSLTEEEVGRWQRAAPAGELEPITDTIARLSGLQPGAQKEAHKSVPGRSDAGVRVLPGGEEAHDGGLAAGQPEQ